MLFNSSFKNCAMAAIFAEYVYVWGGFWALEGINWCVSTAVNMHAVV